MSPVYCGICQKEVKNWRKHEKSKEHIQNLTNPEVMEKALEHHIRDMERFDEEE